MAGRWKKKLERLGRANEEARGVHLRSLTVEKAARILEGMLAHPMVPPSGPGDHPVSLKRRMRRPHV